MEASQPLATDSFSYSWLPLRESTSSSISSTPQAEYQNFNFDTSITHSPSFLAHADELFSDGLIKPVFLDPSTKTKKPNCPSSPRTVEIHHGILSRWKTSTCKTLRILSRYVNQLRKKVRCSRKSNKVDDIGKKEWEAKRWSSFQQESPKPISVYPIGALHDHENSIYEAVLHCKRSIGMTILLHTMF